MAVPYSYDLRCKVLAAINRGMRKSHASQLFQISRNTIDLWLAVPATPGDVRALSRQAAVKRCARRKIVNESAFEAFVRQNPTATQTELAQLWKSPISRQTVGRVLRKSATREKKDLWLH